MRLLLPFGLFLCLAGAACREGSEPAAAPSATPLAATLAVVPTALLATSTATRAPATATVTPAPRTQFSYRFDAVAADDQALVRTGVEIAVDYLRDRAGVELSRLSVYASSDVRKLGEQFALFTIPLGTSGFNFAIRISSGVAEANLGAVFIYTEAPIWKSSNAVQRVRVVAHEVTHVAQFELLGEAAATAFFTRPAGALQQEGPTWLFEGSADLISWRAMEDAGLTSLNAHIRAEAPALASSDLSPRTMEAFVDYLLGGPDAIELSLFASELLLRNKDAGTVAVYFRRLRQGLAWQAAFLEAFGETPEQFYRRFDAYKAARFAAP